MNIFMGIGPDPLSKILAVTKNASLKGTFESFKVEDSIHELYEKFQKGAVQLEQLDNEVRSKAKQQKAKVLDALWKMDIDSRKKIDQEINENKVWFNYYKHS